MSLVQRLPNKEIFRRSLLIGLAYAGVILIAAAVFGAETVEYKVPLVLADFQQLSSNEQLVWLQENEIRHTGFAAIVRVLRDPKQLFQLLLAFLGITLVLASACIIMVKWCQSQPRS
jgi:hypothetical protein